MESITGGNTPKYQELTEQLRLQIVSGEIAPGQKLPSENTLSAQYQVSRQTVRKALAILQNEGYIYAEHGRGTFCSEMMRHAHPSKNIAVVTTYLSDYIFPRVIQGIDDVLTGAGYSIVLKNTKNSRTREAECLQEILSKDIDGVIIEPSKSQIFCRHMNLYEQLEKSHIPYVFIQGCFPQMKDKPHVLLDDFQGGYMITKYLTDHGHKNIVGVFKADDMQGQNRHKGYVRALQEAGILYDPDKVVWFHTEDRKIHPYEAIREMAGKTLRGRMDAVVWRVAPARRSGTRPARAASRLGLGHETLAAVRLCGNRPPGRRPGCPCACLRRPRRGRCGPRCDRPFGTQGQSAPARLVLRPDAARAGRLSAHVELLRFQ